MIAAVFAILVVHKPLEECFIFRHCRIASLKHESQIHGNQ